MASKVSIINRALTKLNAKRITSINDKSKNATDAKAVWDDLVDEILASFAWNFATRRIQLSRLSDSPVYDYDYQFRIPSEPVSLHIWEMVSDSETPVKEYVIEADDSGLLLLTNYTVAYIKHTVRITDPQHFSPLFIEVLATRLAAELAYSITGKVSVRDSLTKEYFFKLQVAGMKEAQQGEDYVADDEKHPIEDDWLAIRNE